MRGRACNAATVVCLLLGVAAAGLWARSCYRQHGYNRALGDRNYNLVSVCGRVSFSWSSADAGWRDYRGGGWVYRPAPAAGRLRIDQLYGWYHRRLLGFGYGHDVFGTSITTGTQTAYFVVVPHWFLAAVCVVLPTARAATALRRRRRRQRGACPACGYDLRVTLGRCPECGSVP